MPAVIINCDVWDESAKSHITRYFETLLKDCYDQTILPSNLKEVLVTEHYSKEYQTIADRFGLARPLADEPEYQSGAKVCYNYNSPELDSTLLIDARVFNGTTDPSYFITTLLVQEYAQTLLPDDLKNRHSYQPTGSLREIALTFFANFFQTVYAQVVIAPPDRASTPPNIPVKNLLAPFKRRIKYLHNKHQADFDWDYCKGHFYEAVFGFINRYLNIFAYKIEVTELQEFGPVMISFCGNLIRESEKVKNGERYEIEFMEKALIDIAALCYFDLKIDGQMQVGENPKKLFPDLIDTHDRIVGFVDILGFKEMIRQFDKEKDILTLTDLKEVLDEAIEEMQKLFKYGEHDIEFRLFSDCLCVSLPYFDNDYDFTRAFGAIMLGLKTYQMKFLFKGHLVRGGVAFGGYYSDFNMIFSGALVDAYEYESLGNTRKIPKYDYRPPRILIAPEIIRKLENTKVAGTMLPFYENSILIDKDGEYFINPVFSTEASKKTYESILTSLADDEGGILKSLNELNRSLIESILPFVGEDSEKIMLTGLMTILDEKMNTITDQKVLPKYQWTKDVLSDMYSGFTSGAITVHHPNLKIYTD